MRAADDAERMLLRKLRTRSLSLREARAALRDHDLDDAEREEIVERFVSLGYLDDLALAEQLIDKATSRKAQGRQAIAQTLSQRSIPREVIDEALEALPDDEAERALEFARSKAAGFDGVERDAALRRLAGQLARRGYGAVALSAARQALDERSAPPRHGVRFEP
ncbi:MULTISPECIES: regulatory protein RecX [unclassified Microbacterium]|uniref:regulatory protein RecX n=1 Tax=unclassified Microbacterium TaxID=2609290 RepID=UPI002004B665|nr:MULTISPECIES: regulatory protein RecX [unclassified Microbacterium]